jgi:hypothetical protein
MTHWGAVCALPLVEQVVDELIIVISSGVEDRSVDRGEQ